MPLPQAPNTWVFCPPIALRAGNFLRISVCCAPSLRIDLFNRSDPPDTADDFLAKSHSQPQELGVRFAGWCGLPKMNQASPREAGHKPAF
ncbi:hypothetical protein EMIT051CA3_80123 [Pseudomonas chlororaphis]